MRLLKIAVILLFGISTAFATSPRIDMTNAWRDSLGGVAGSGGSGGGLVNYSSSEARARAAADQERHNRISAEYEARRSAYSEPIHIVTRMQEGYERLKALVDRRNEVRDRVQSMDYPEVRRAYVDIATESLKVSREFYKAEEYEEGGIAARYAEIALDLATSFTPGVSFGRDIYESITGFDLITGEKLGTFSRTVAMISAATLGIGSSFARCGKILAKIMKSGKDFETCVHEFKVAKRIPKDWGPIKASKFEPKKPDKELGVIFAKEGSSGADAIRIMPGDPNSPFVNSRSTYVRLQKGGDPYDKFGNRLENKYCEEAHIPVDEFIFPF
jgi:hypothetical protein